MLQVDLIENDDMMETFAPYGADESLDVSRLLPKRYAFTVCSRPMCLMEKLVVGAAKRRVPDEYPMKPAFDGVLWSRRVESGHSKPALF